MSVLRVNLLFLVCFAAISTAFAAPNADVVEKSVIKNANLVKVLEEFTDRPGDRSSGQRVNGDVLVFRKTESLPQSSSPQSYRYHIESQKALDFTLISAKNVGSDNAVVTNIQHDNRNINIDISVEGNRDAALQFEVYALL